jgi:hypothetical protein
MKLACTPKRDFWLLACRSVRRDRPEPAAIIRRSVRPHDPANVLLAVEYVVVVVRPSAAQGAFYDAWKFLINKLISVWALIQMTLRAPCDSDLMYS